MTAKADLEFSWHVKVRKIMDHKKNPMPISNLIFGSVPSRWLQDVIDGTQIFTKEFANEVWLEILFVKGVNDGFSEVENLAKAAQPIKPDQIRISTIVRPPGVGHAPPVGADRFNEIARKFEGKVEVVVQMSARDKPAYCRSRIKEIVAMPKIRPMTSGEISLSSGWHDNEIIKYLDQLRKDRIVREIEFPGKKYFTIGDKGDGGKQPWN